MVIIGGITAAVIAWQSVETRRAANASKDAVEAARDSGVAMVNSERAWVLVEIGKLPDFQPNPDHLEFLWIHTTIKNYGKTPARIKKMVAVVKLVPDGETLPQIPVYPVGQGLNLETDIVLPPSVNVQPIRLAVSGQEFIQVQRQEIFLYCMAL